MSVNLDDSGVFRVPAAQSGAKVEIRVPPKETPLCAQPDLSPSAPASQQSSLATPANESAVRIDFGSSTRLAPPSAKISLPATEETDSPRVHSADAPREVRVPIDPAPMRPPPPSTTSPKIAPAIEKEHRVPFPTATRPQLRYAADFTRVSLSARKLEFPSTCPCCKRPADMSYDAVVEKKRDRQNSKHWTFPYCGTCLRHVRQARWQRYAVRGTSGLIAIAVVGLGFFAGFLIPGAIAGSILGAAGWFLGERLLYGRLADVTQAECACYGPAVRFAEYYATEQHFDFANAAYAEEFVTLNERKLL